MVKRRRRMFSVLAMLAGRDVPTLGRRGDVGSPDPEGLSGAGGGR